MNVNFCSRLIDLAFNDKQPYKVPAIALLPIVGLVWGMYRQNDLQNRISVSKDNNEKFELLKEKNLVKKIYAFGGLVQLIAYVAIKAFCGLSIFAAITSHPFVPITLALSFVFFTTAKINEFTTKKPGDGFIML